MMMGLHRWVLLGCLALLLFVFALQATRWMMRNDFDLVIHQQFPEDTQRNEAGLLCVFPSGAEEEAKVVPLDIGKVQTLGEVIRETSRTSGLAYVGEFDNFCYIRSFCEKHPSDIFAHFYYATMLSDSISVITKKDKKDRSYDRFNLAKKQAKCREMLAVTEKLETLDPDNLCYPLWRAAAYAGLGDLGKARSEIIRASQMHRYETYPYEAGKATASTYETLYGYRGEFVRQNVSGMNESHLSTFKSVFRWAKEQEDASLTIAMLRISDVMLHRSQTGTGLVYIKGLIAIPLDLKINEQTKKVGLPEFEKGIQAVAPVANKLGFNLTSFARNASKLFEKDYWRIDDSDSRLFAQNPRAFTFEIAPSLLVAWLVFLPLVWFFNWLLKLKLTRDNIARAMPHLVFLSAVFLGADLRNYLIGLFASLFFITMFAKKSWIDACRVVGYLAAVVASLLAFTGWLDGVWVGLAFIVVDLLSRWTPRPVPATIVSVIVSLVLFAGPVLLSLALIEGMLGNSLLWLILGVVIFCALIPRIERLPRWLPVAAMSLYFVGYMGTIGWRYQDNLAIEKHTLRWEHGGDLMREYYGIK